MTAIPMNHWGCVHHASIKDGARWQAWQGISIREPRSRSTDLSSIEPTYCMEYGELRA